MWTNLAAFSANHAQAQTFVKGIEASAWASKLSGYILGPLITIFIIIGIGLNIKYAIDRRSNKNSNKKLLIAGILTVAIGSVVCGVLLAILQNVIFKQQAQKLADELAKIPNLIGSCGTTKGSEWDNIFGKEADAIFKSLIAAVDKLGVTLKESISA